MGTYKYDGPSMTSYPVNAMLKVTDVPANVILLMESMKPNWNTPDATAGNYKYYFQKNSEVWKPTSFTGSGPASTLTTYRYATPHTKNKRMNVLSADGHIS